ncbi:MAG: dipeptide epimerase [Pseudomonadota bacterium]
MPELSVTAERFALRTPFRIARGSKTHADVVLVSLHAHGCTGRGECVPYARYGETIDSVIAQVRDAEASIAGGASWDDLEARLGRGAALNAIDTAMVDLAAKRRGVPAGTFFGQPPAAAVTTAVTLSLDSPDLMAEAARAAAAFPLLKLKLGGGHQDANRMHAVRRARPDARLIVDANEAWASQAGATTAADGELIFLLTAAADADIELVEQPVPADADHVLADIAHPVPICADEALSGTVMPYDLADRYDAVNLKLDKAGGPTGLMQMLTDAQAVGLDVMLGCMVATSLAMAPAFLFTHQARWVDLDGPLLLAEDRPHALRAEGATLHPPSPALWG